MKPIVEQAVSELENLAANIMGTYQGDQPFNEVWGWNMPPLSRSEIADMPRDLAAALRAVGDKDVGTTLEARLSAVPARVQKLTAEALPNLPGGNAPLVVAQITALLSWVSSALPVPIPSKVSIDWQATELKKELPPALIRRLRSIEGSLAQLEPRTQAVGAAITAIEDAKIAAEELPATRQDLQEALAASADARLAIEANAKVAAGKIENIEEAMIKLRKLEVEAAKIVANCGETYRITTTIGLAAAFDQKAKSLTNTMSIWVVALAFALIAIGTLAYLRVNVLQGLMQSGRSPGEIWTNVALSIFNVAAPVWFAWVATKQIGQRFRLAEDYGFKASVAKAYEGYRREASRIDPAFEARLFSSALDRLEEAPLRLMEKETFGSPFHELTASPAFEKALALIPELKQKYGDIVGSSAAAVVSGGARGLAKLGGDKNPKVKDDKPLGD